MIDWPKFFDKHRVDYAETGPSTSKGNIYVHCPWCGPADEGQHLGIHTKRGKGWRGYGCWRDQRHRGRDPRRLVAGVLGISLARAGELLGSDAEAPGLSSMPISERVKAMKNFNKGVPSHTLDFTPEMKQIEDKGQGDMFLRYLMSRGFTRNEAVECCFRYKLRYAMTGAYKYRLIIPVYDDNELVTWTGRSIVTHEQIRYKSLSKDPEKAQVEEMPRALGSITDYIWNEGSLLTKHGRGLIVCEGPLDAIKVDFFCQQTLGVHATCLFGKALYPLQVATLHEIAPYYMKKFLLLDRDTGTERHKMIQKIYHQGYRLLDLPKGKFKDPGEMPKRELIDFIERKCA